MTPLNNDFKSSKEDKFWEEGYFAESISSEEMKKKMKSFNMEHDEDVNYNCKKCNKKISLHNKNWHDEMCDECFNKTYYPEIGGKH